MTNAQWGMTLTGIILAALFAWALCTWEVPPTDDDEDKWGI